MHQKKIRIGMAVKIDENIQEQLANFDLRWTVTTFTLAQHWLLDIRFGKRNIKSQIKTFQTKSYYVVKTGELTYQKTSKLTSEPF